MVNIISTTTPTANGPRAMTLQALKARQAELELQQAQVAKPHEVTSIPQGIGDIANAFFTARRGDYLANKENQTRQQLAQMRAGWSPTGPTQAQAAEYAALDPEEGNRVADASMKAAQDTAAQNALFGQQNALEEKREGFEGGQGDLNRNVQTAGQQNTREIADAQLAQNKAKQDYAEAHPDIQSVPQALSALQAGQLGPVGSPEAKANYDAIVNKLTAVPNSSESTEITVPGPTPESPSTTIRTTKGGGSTGSQGGKAGAGQGIDYNSYVAADKQASDILNTVQQQKEALKNPGYQGPGGTMIGKGEDIANYGLKQLGWTGPEANAITGDPASRSVISDAKVQAMFDAARQLPGAFSNKEGAAAAQKGISLENPQVANELKIGMAERFARNAQTRKQLADGWLRDPNHKGSLSGFEEQVWTPYLDSHPVTAFNPESGALELAPEGGAAPAAAAPAANGGGGGSVPTPKTPEEFNALAPGTIYIDPDDGRKYRK